MAANNAPVQRVQTVQAGVEVTAGTAVAATRVVDMAPGGAEFTPTHDPIAVPQAGDLAETVQVYAGLTGVKLMVPVNTSYDDLPWWMNFFATPVTAPSSAGTGTVSANSLANPTIITASAPHGLATGDTTTITGSNSTPSINGTFVVTVTDSTHFSISVNVSVAGTAGSFTKPPYTYAQTPSATSDDPTRATFEVGGLGTPAWPSEFQLSGMAGESWDLDFQKNGIWQLKVGLVGQVVTPQAKTAALSARTLKYIRTLDTKAYLNGTGSAFGNTQLVTRVVKGNIKYETGADPRQTWEGTGDPSMIAMVGPQKVSGSIQLHFSSNSEYTTWKAGTVQRLRVEATGPVLDAANYKATLDLGIFIKAWKIVKDRGLMLAQLDFAGVKDSTLGSQVKSTTLNDSATLV